MSLFFHFRISPQPSTLLIIPFFFLVCKPVLVFPVLFFFCGRSAVLRPSVHMLPGIGRCGAVLLMVDSSCGHNWCLCFHQMGQSWRMWWTVCCASLQSQGAESMMPIRFRCARRPQCPVRNLNVVVSSCLARRLIESVEGL